MAGGSVGHFGSLDVFLRCAYRLKIRDITNNSGAVVRFSEVANLESKQVYEAKGSFENFTEFAPFFSHNFDAFLMAAKEGRDVPESVNNAMAPKTLKVIVDYFNASDMWFTAELEIRRSLEEGHTRRSCGDISIRSGSHGACQEANHSRSSFGPVESTNSPFSVSIPYAVNNFFMM
jgi:hypothetical protein